MSNIFSEVLREAGHVVSKDLDSLILFITSACQQRCFSCFYWSELNQKNNLTHEQLLEMADKAPQFRSLLLSGGEPFLRPKISEILDRFAKKAGIRYLAIPTNGGYAAKVETEMSEFLEKNPQVFCTMAVSIDGFEKTHEKIRGIPRAWELALQTLNILKTMRKKFSNLRVNINTCLCKDNIREISEFVAFVDKELDVDYHTLEYIRGDPKNPELLLGPDDARLYLKLKADVSRRYYAQRSQTRLYPGPTKGISRYYMEGMELVQRQIKKDVFLNKKGWPFPCLAGKTIAVVDHDGSMRACELRGRILKLQDFDMDLKRALDSDAMRGETQAITRDRCDRECTHGCFVDSSQKHSLGNILLRIPALKTRRALGAL